VPLRLRIAWLAGAAALMACLVAAVAWWRSPGLVPDHAAAFSASAQMLFAGQNSLAQQVIPFRDGLTRVDVLVAAESAGLPGDAELRVEAWPSRRLVRVARRLVAAIPVGSAWSLRLGQSGEQWTSFSFEPLPDSAGQEYLLVLRYPDGPDVPDRRLATLAHFPGTYLRGQILVNGAPNDGTLLFRLSAAGTHGQALRAAAYNVARRQPLGRDTLVAPGLLALLCAALLLGIGRAMWRLPSEAA
jgi:hypothetical protein